MILHLEAEIEVTDDLQQLGFDTIGEQIEYLLPKYCHNIERLRKVRISRTIYEGFYDDHEEFNAKEGGDSNTKETPAIPTIDDDKDELGMVEFPHY
ncbi:hypothetical protein LCGC14_1507290 [marine sediment metagenome]|uniref:Uncharacterized protein n=1 Tax=marine sediment metagenome TaxID=412755 RepID=A0A0F9J2F4_9ZZZZ